MKRINNVGANPGSYELNNGAAVKNATRMIEENAAKLLNTAFRITGNLADAEDVCQEVFAEFFRMENIDPQKNPPALLRRMTVCRSIDLIRSRKECKCLPDWLSDQTTSQPIDSVALKELETQVRAVIRQLPKREAEVCCLVFFEQFSHSEVGKLLGISRNAVAKSLCSARTKLESKLTNVFGSIE